MPTELELIKNPYITDELFSLSSLRETVIIDSGLDDNFKNSSVDRINKRIDILLKSKIYTQDPTEKFIIKK